jgi:transcriptional regulator with GAF, ATPase, and Fis domain
MLSGEALAIHGEGLAKFKLAQFSGAALIAPISVKDQPVGVISVGRKAPRPFTERQLVMLEAVADYASISLVNARLFEALEDRAQRLEREIQRSTERDQVDAKWLKDVHRNLRAAQAEIASLMSKRQAARLSKELGTVMNDIESVLDGISDIVDERSGDPTP